MKKHIIQTDQAPAAVGPYSQAVAAGPLVFVSGQIPLNIQGELVKGDIVVRIREGGQVKDVPVREGETFFIPGNVPHAPTRPPDTIGVVVERRRPPGETEHQQFYCDGCGELVYDKEFDCADIVEHFTQSMEAFWADPELSTCKKCGTRVEKPTSVKRILFEPEIVIERE